MRRHASTVSFDAVAVVEGVGAAVGGSGGPESLSASAAAPREVPAGDPVVVAVATGRSAPREPPAPSVTAPFRAKNERMETSAFRFAPMETPAARGDVSVACGGAPFRKKLVSLAWRPARASAALLTSAGTPRGLRAVTSSTL